MKKRNLIAAFVFLCLSISLYAQDQGLSRDQALRIFFDCTSCDTDYIRKEVTFVNYVRDRMDAQVHILTTTAYTGAGGQKQTFYFIGQQEYSGQADTLSFF